MMSIEQDKDNSPGKGVGVGLKKERFFMRVKMCDKNKIKNKKRPLSSRTKGVNDAKFLYMLISNLNLYNSNYP